jgi:branched-chain amino acid transport system ATP-binding protein
MNILTVEKLTKTFGGLTAVSNVNFAVEEGALVGIIGPNGAGKTTIFNLLTGVYVPTTGKIILRKSEGRELHLEGKKPYQAAAHGVARTFQNIRLFKDLTVLDNVRIAMHGNVGYSLMSTFFRPKLFYREETRIRLRAYELLDIFHMSDKAEELARNLPYGDQRHLEIVRAMAIKPKLLLLDEPAAGMNPNETQELTRTIAQIRKDFDLTIVLIEHDMSLVMNICEKIYVLDYGMLIAQGTAEEIKHNKKVIEAYLGEDAANA